MTASLEKKKRRGRSNEERRAEIDALAAQLNAAVTELTSADAWLRMLRVSAMFTKYSPTNALYLWLQAEQRGVPVTKVAGYHTWKRMGRQVVKGAKSFAVCAPVRRRLSEEEADNLEARGVSARQGDGRPVVTVRGFKLERVFRFEDTEGEPLPAAPDLGYVTGDSAEDAWPVLVQLAAADGFTVTTVPETDGSRGHTNYSTRTVNVDPTYELAEQVHILVHEIGHVRCGHEHRRVSRAQRETEAESVAFIVCTALGLTVGDVSAVYAGGWNDGDPELIQAAQTAIHKAAQSILSDLENPDDEADSAADEEQEDAFDE